MLKRIYIYSTNYFEPLPDDGTVLKSRGGITRQCLESPTSIEEDLENVSQKRNEVGPFNLLLMQIGKQNVKYGYATNRSITENYHGMFDKQIGGMSNGYIDANSEIASIPEWHKVKNGKKYLKENLKEDMSEKEVLETLENAIK